LVSPAFATDYAGTNTGTVGAQGAVGQDNDGLDGVDSFIPGGNGGNGADGSVGGTGGDGATGGSGVAQSTGIVNNTGTITGGVGGRGGSGGSSKGGAGGDGNSGTAGNKFFFPDGQDGGNGGNGGNAGSGGDGGTGGTGGSGLAGSGLIVTNSGTIRGGAGGLAGFGGSIGVGGAGGVGGDGGSGEGAGSNGGNGGHGGDGGTGLNGGDGGYGGRGGDGDDSSGSGGSGGDGGYGGNGDFVGVNGTGGMGGTGDSLGANGLLNTNGGTLPSLSSLGLTFGAAGIAGNGGAGITLTGGTNVISNLSGGIIQGGDGIDGGNGIDITGGTTEIDNFGSILGGAGGTTFGIKVTGGTVTSLANAQGANGALSYSGALPVNYSIIVNSPTSYGKLAVSNATGSTIFGIHNTSTLSAGTYTAVLSGLTSSNVDSANRVGSFGTFSWLLELEAGSTTIWDLIVAFMGPSAADTQASLEVSASRLRPAYALQHAALASGLSYDCAVFDKNGICISLGGRNSRINVNGVNSSNGLLIGGYRVNDVIRVGAWLDQNISSSTDAGVKLSNSSPMFGAYGVWNANKSGEGLEAKFAVGYGGRDMTITRDVVGTSEAGSGTSRLTTQGVSATLSYNIRMNEKWVASPFAGVRQTKLTASGYSETASNDVTAPLTYASLVQEASTGTAGVKLRGLVTPTMSVQAAAGLEQDFSSKKGTYSASGVSGLTDIAFNPDAKKTRTAVALGLLYHLKKNQRIALNVMRRAEPLQSEKSTTALLSFTAGF
jgi:hypothetical protein